MKNTLLALLAFASLASQAHSKDGKLCQGYLPKNTMWIADTGVRVKGGIDEATFNSLLDRIEAEYSAEVAAAGATLKIDRQWTSGEVNAYASREGSTWIISMFGGFARHAKVTYDGFMGVACHEMGHHLGGAPLYARDWASVEGQSDYYSTLKCLRRIFAKDDNKKVLAGMTLDPVAVSTCNAEHSSQDDQLLCIRSAMAALSLGEVLAEFDSTSTLPKLDTPDRREVRRTDPNHPRAQCRVDTLFNAAQCRVPVAQAVSSTDYRAGTCYTPEHSKGFRPRCWFAPPAN